MAHFIAKFVIRHKGKVYAIFTYDRKLELIIESDKAKKDKLRQSLTDKILIWHTTRFKERDVGIGDLKDALDARYYMEAKFMSLSRDYRINSYGLDEAVTGYKGGIYID